jgi:hypothetical protein
MTMEKKISARDKIKQALINLFRNNKKRMISFQSFEYFFTRIFI